MAALLAAPLAVETAAAATTATPSKHSRLTNLAHLDWLGDTITPPAQAGHTTYQPRQRPVHRRPSGPTPTATPTAPFRHVGGGDLRRRDQHVLRQGAFNADDLTRALVVYLRGLEPRPHTRRAATNAKQLPARRSPTSRPRPAPTPAISSSGCSPTAPSTRARHPSRAAGPLRQRAPPSGSPGRSGRWGRATPPSVAATPHFAGVPRPSASTSTISRPQPAGTSPRYGQYLNIDGRSAPPWLNVDGADSSAEAVLGPHGIRQGGRGGRSTGSSRAATELAEGVASVQAGTAQAWPLGAILPWALSRSDLARLGMPDAGPLAPRPRSPSATRTFARVAAIDWGRSSPWLLTAGGRENGLHYPTPPRPDPVTYGLRLAGPVARSPPPGGPRAAGPPPGSPPSPLPGY